MVDGIRNEGNRVRTHPDERRTDRGAEGTVVGAERQRGDRQLDQHRAEEADLAAALRRIADLRQLEHDAHRRPGPPAGSARTPAALSASTPGSTWPTTSATTRGPSSTSRRACAGSRRAAITSEVRYSLQPQRRQRRQRHPAAATGAMTCSPFRTCRATAATTRRRTSRSPPITTSCVDYTRPFGNHLGVPQCLRAAHLRRRVLGGRNAERAGRLDGHHPHVPLLQAQAAAVDEPGRVQRVRSISGVPHNFLVGWDHQDYHGRTTRSNAANITTTPIERVRSGRDASDVDRLHASRGTTTPTELHRRRCICRITSSSGPKVKAVFSAACDYVDRSTHNNPVVNGVETEAR